MKILVLGDIMTDIDITCEIVKWYGSAPVLREVSHIERPGGAANVAEMCKALGAEVLLCGVPELERQPTIKRRFLVDGKLVARHDTEDMALCYWTIPQHGPIYDFLMSADGIIVADHGKGFVQQAMMHSICNSKASVFVDPVPTTPVVHSDYITWIGSEDEIPYKAMGRKIIKLGANGIRFWTHRVGWQTWPSKCSQCVDDIGAGDQFLASFVVASLSGYEFVDAVGIAHQDAGEQCRRVGIQPVTR